MNDFIRRKDAIKLIQERYECPEICIAEINQIPTADVVKVVHGEWIEPYVLFSDRVCSVCGYKTTTSHALSYCTNCGAKMDGKKEG